MKKSVTRPPAWNAAGFVSLSREESVPAGDAEIDVEVDVHGGSSYSKTHSSSADAPRMHVSDGSGLFIVVPPVLATPACAPPFTTPGLPSRAV